jgi:hypothetical protein
MARKQLDRTRETGRHGKRTVDMSRKQLNKAKEQAEKARNQARLSR